MANGEGMSRVSVAPRNGVDSDPLKRVPLSDLAAERMRRLILDDRLRPGDPLPTQQELMERYGVSRTVIREAVRSLVQQGLIKVQPGRGMTVNAPTMDALVQQLTVLLRTNQTTVHQLFELRILLEPAIAAAAAREHTPDDQLILEEILAEAERSMQDVRAFLEYDLAFNRALAEATHNPFYVVAAMPIETVLKNTYHVALGFMQPHYIHTVKEHRHILDAVIARDSEGAALASRRHLERVARSLEQILRQERAALTE